MMTYKANANGTAETLLSLQQQYLLFLCLLQRTSSVYLTCPTTQQLIAYRNNLLQLSTAWNALWFILAFRVNATRIAKTFVSF
jgi:hypothetical protein